MLKRISVTIDSEKFMKGDVIIIKRTFWDPRRKDKLSTLCTKCGDSFRTELRRMERLDKKGVRSCEVRNVPQCQKCRRWRGEMTPLITDPARLLPAHVEAHEIERAEGEGMPS